MAQKGDFIGFTFNGTHSSDLGIVRTSNGSRYNSNLLPSSSDQTVAVPGGDGVYFFGSNYLTRVFQLLIASDEISESTMRRILQVWGDKEIHELIFDETPYKVYMAKCTNMPQFNFLCFDENNQRVYKGEGSVEFTCYYPYAKSRYKFLDEYGRDEDPHEAVPEWNGGEFALGDGFLHNHHLLGYGVDIVFEDVYTIWTPTGETEEERMADWENHKNELYIKDEDEYIRLSEDAQYDDEELYYTYERVPHELINPQEDYTGATISLVNIDEWSAASGILDSNPYNGYTFDTPYYVTGSVNNLIRVYNPGDIDADFLLWFKPNAGAEASILFYHGSSPDTSKLLNLSAVTLLQSDVWILYDSRTELLTGYASVNSAPSSHLYNKYIKTGDFFKIPIIKGDYTYTILAVNAELGKIAYDYLYY